MTAATALTFGLPIVAQAQSTYSNSGYAHQACKNKEDNRQILGGLAGAVVGGVFGSQVSGNGARTEGSAIGAVLGGLAGAGIADKTIDCDPVYETQPYPSYGSTSSYPASYPSYGSTTSYPATSSYPVNTVYTDQVTYSNHPVYSDPNYGTGAVTNGTTYSTGTVSYPSNQQSAPTYQTISYPTSSYPSSSYGGTTTYQTVPSARSYNTSYNTGYTTSYAQPVRYVSPYPTTRPTGFHRHGSYGCSANH